MTQDVVINYILEVVAKDADLQRRYGARLASLQESVECANALSDAGARSRSSSRSRSPLTTSGNSSSEDEFQLVERGKRRKGKRSKGSKAPKASPPSPPPPPQPLQAVYRPPSPRPSRPVSPMADSPASPMADSPASPSPPSSPMAPRAARPIQPSAIAGPSSRPDSPMALSPATPTSSARKLKAPPPLYIQDKSKWTEVSKFCAERRINYTSARSTAQGIRVQVPTTTDFRDLSRELRGRQIAFHTYSLPEDIPVRVVIRRVPREISTEEILQDLQAQDIPALKVHRLHKARGGDQYDMVLVICEQTTGPHPIFKIKSICSLTGIKVEKPYKSSIVGQCHRCQLYGHSQGNCFAPHRCVKCLGAHSTADCPRPKDVTQCTEPPSCVLCGQAGHPANYRGCPKAPKLAQRRLAKRHSARQQRESPSVKAPQPPPARLSPQRPSPWNALNHQRAFPSLRPTATPSIPGLMDTAVPPPVAVTTPTLVERRTTPAPIPTAQAPGPVRNSPAPPNGERAIDIIFNAYRAFFTPAADRMAAEVKAAGNNAQKLLEILGRYPDIERALGALNYD